MTKIITSLILLAFSLSLLSPPAMAAAGAEEFMLLYSNNVNGETEPCG